MKSRQPLKDIPFQENIINPNISTNPQQNAKVHTHQLQINTTPPIPPKRKPSEQSLRYVSSYNSLKSNSIDLTQNDNLSQRLNNDSPSFPGTPTSSSPSPKQTPCLSWLDRNRFDSSVDVIHSLEFHQSFDSPIFTAKFPPNASPILEFPNNSKDPLTFCVDQSSTNRVNPNRMLPKIRPQNWLELELDIVVTLRLEAQEKVKRHIIHSGAEDEQNPQEEGLICSIHNKYHWFLLHTDGEQSIDEITTQWLTNLNDSKTFTSPNLYPIHPTPIENKPNLYKWNWNWSHLTNPTCMFVGHKNLCTLIKIPIESPHTIIPVISFAFWTEAVPTRPRRKTLLGISSPRGKSASTPHILSGSDSNEPTDVKSTAKGSHNPRSSSLSNNLIPTNESNPNDSNEYQKSDIQVLNGTSHNQSTTQLDDLSKITPNPEPTSYSDSSPQLPSSLDLVEDTDLVIDNYSSEDGPVFRATISQLEKKVFSFKHDIKRLTKLGQEVIETRKAAISTESEFHSSICSLPAIRPLVASYLREAAGSIVNYESTWMENFQSLILDPLNNLYEQDIKLAESKKKHFDQTSDDFYNFLNKYLGAKNKNNKQNLSEAKYNNRRRIFELSRFDYFNYLSELRGGGKDQDLLNLFTIYSETQYTHYNNIQKSLFRLHDNLLDLDRKISQSNHILMLQRKDRRKQRQEIDSSNPVTQEINPSTNKSVNDANTSPNSKGGTNEREDPNHKFKGIRDLQMSNREATLAIGRKREGFLFTPSKTSSTSNVLDKNLGINASFHKKWCVLSGGYIHEYSNWKRQLESNSEPIPLQFSTVRVASQLSRRFCFEIVTPKFKKIYQAMSEDDMLAWISCISNSIESLWNGTSSCDDIKFKEQTPSNKHKSTTPSILPHNPILGEFDSEGRSDNPDQITLIEKLRQIDPSNIICADCDTSNPEWCSINFGILLCIECSGLHRSLGTHITKVRSLILDVTTFTPDLVTMIESIGNRRANLFWEARMDENKGFVEPTGEKWVKPIISDDRGLKLKFVKAKYIEHKFVDRSLPPLGDSSAFKNLINVPAEQSHVTQALFDACFKHDLIAVLKFIILGGVVNSYCNINPGHNAYSLTNSIPISPLQLALFGSTHIDNCQDYISVKQLYTLPELLIQNGANVNQLNPVNQETVLHHAARLNNAAILQYLISKGADPALPLNNPNKWPNCLTTDPVCQNILSEATLGSNNPSAPKSNVVQFRASPIINGKSHLSMPPSSQNLDSQNPVSSLGVLLEGSPLPADIHQRMKTPSSPSSPHSRSYSLQPQLLYSSRQNRHSDPTDLAESPRFHINETGGVSQSSSNKSSPSDLKNSINIKSNFKGFKNQINSFTQSHHAIHKTKDTEETGLRPGRNSISHDRTNSKLPSKHPSKFSGPKFQNHSNENSLIDVDGSTSLPMPIDPNTSDMSTSDQGHSILSHSLPAASLLSQLDEKLENSGSGFKRPVIKLPTSLLGKIKKISK